MTFTFLKEEIETIMLFVSAPIYVAIIAILQSKNLKVLKELKRKNRSDAEKLELRQRLRKLKFLSPLFMMIPAFINTLAYLYFSFSLIRPGYFISIGIVYLMFVFIALVNFYLKGAGVLKDVGDFCGLPGN